MEDWWFTLYFFYLSAQGSYPCFLAFTLSNVKMYKDGRSQRDPHEKRTEDLKRQLVPQTPHYVKLRTLVGACSASFCESWSFIPEDKFFGNHCHSNVTETRPRLLSFLAITNVFIDKSGTEVNLKKSFTPLTLGSVRRSFPATSAGGRRDSCRRRCCCCRGRRCRRRRRPKFVTGQSAQKTLRLKK